MFPHDRTELRVVVKWQPIGRDALVPASGQTRAQGGGGDPQKLRVRTQRDAQIRRHCLQCVQRDGPRGKVS